MGNSGTFFSCDFRVRLRKITKGGYRMRRLTLLLFQLFLAVFAGYAVLYDVPNHYLLVPLLCLVCMLFLGRYQDGSSKSEQRELAVDT